MADRCLRACFRTNNFSNERNGWRGSFFFQKGGNYKGFWLNSERHFYGVQKTPKGLIYDGQWQQGKRHGYGTIRKLQKPETDKGQPQAQAQAAGDGGIYLRKYIGEWRNDKKCGEGKQYYPNGVYYGWWENNRRHGLGLMLYNDDRIYMGEWAADVYHGLGVLIYANGNRYEGCFARGYKNGEGTFYHMHTGQIQKGMWENDICKTSLMQDEFRHQVKMPTKYPIPKCQLADCDNFVRRIFCKYMKNERKPSRSLQESICLHFARQNRFYAKLEPSAVWHTNIPFDVSYPCVCKQNEKLVVLRENDKEKLNK